MIYLVSLFVISMGCEVKYVKTTESTNILYISVQLICPTAITNYHQRVLNKYAFWKKLFCTEAVLHFWSRN